MNDLSIQVKVDFDDMIALLDDIEDVLMKHIKAKMQPLLVQKVTDQYSVAVHDKIYEYGSCGACRAPVIKPDKYCSECGAKLNWE